MSFDYELQAVSICAKHPTAPCQSSPLSDLFKGADGVPSQEWFDNHIPLDDRHGSIYYALLDLEKRARSYSPTAPKNVWDLLPLHLHIIMSFTCGCAYYQQSIAHAVKCPGCDVCEKSDTFSMMLITDSHFKAWNEMYGEEAMKEITNTDERVQVPLVENNDLEKVKKRLDGPVRQATPEPTVTRVETPQPYIFNPPEYDGSEWDLDRSRM